MTRLLGRNALPSSRRAWYGSAKILARIGSAVMTVDALNDLSMMGHSVPNLVSRH